VVSDNDTSKRIRTEISGKLLVKSNVTDSLITNDNKLNLLSNVLQISDEVDKYKTNSCSLSKADNKYVDNDSLEINNNNIIFDVDSEKIEFNEYFTE